MVVCQCKVVRDGEIRLLVDAGVVTLDELGARCGAGTRCGSCVDTLTRILDAVRLGEERAA